MIPQKVYLFPFYVTDRQSSHSYGGESPKALDFAIVADSSASEGPFRILESEIVMRPLLSRVFALALGIGLFCPAQGFGQEKEEPKKTPFQETSDSLLAGSAMQLMEHWHFPHYRSWARWNVGGLDAEFQKRFKSFPEELLKALGNRESADHESAVGFVAFYAALARGHAARLNQRHLSSAVDRALAPDTDKIREGLVASLLAKAAKTRVMAAIAVLSLDESHAKANEVIKASVASADSKVLWEASRLIGLAHLTSSQAVECLRRLLKHRDPYVRHNAAWAVIMIGPAARELAPALVAFLETGEDAEGEYYFPYTMAPPQHRNLALMALESLKEHAKPAVPAILARFAKAKDRDQIAMLACLASIGCKEDACLAVMRKSLESEDWTLKLTAACAMLHLAPEDRTATELVKKSLADKSIKKLAMEVCQEVGPPSREIVASLLPQLDHQEQEVRIDAMRALAGIGPHATEAVPGLEKLLAKEEDGMTHTFVSTRAAAYALGKIRGKEAAAAFLRVADSKVSGARYSMTYLPDFGDDLPTTTVAVLARAMESDDRPKDMAAMALSNLGERARPVRRHMERLLEDPAIGWIIDTALRRIPANPR